MSSPGCGMHYRRITEVEADKPALRSVQKTQHAEAVEDSSGRNSRKRKKPVTFHRYDNFEKDRSNGVEIESEDDIHAFRRVHVKSQKLEHRATWSSLNKHPSIVLGHAGLEVEIFNVSWPARLKAIAIHANRHFDKDFHYFEIQLSSVTTFAADVGIGLSTTHNKYCMPGMIASSWGFHSDDGNSFRCVNTKTYKKTRVRNFQSPEGVISRPNIRADLIPIIVLPSLCGR